MNDEIYVYIIIFLLCVILVGSFLFYQIHQVIISSGVADSTFVEEELIEDPYLNIVLEEPPRRSFLDGTAAGGIAPPALKEHEEQYLELARQIRLLFAPEIPEEAPITIVDLKAQFDSTLAIREAQMTARMVAQRNSLNSTIATLRQDNRALQDSIATRDRSILRLQNSIIGLNRNIALLRVELETAKTPVIVETPPPPPPPPDYRQLARIYNGMDAKRVATLMQQMPIEHSVEVLKLLQQRKQAQVIAALPQDIAAQYSQKLLESQGR